MTRGLRTTPERKPRTECCCHSVVFIMAAMVAPVGDRNIAMIRACFEPGSVFLSLGSAAICCDGFAAGTGAADDAAGRFFADFDIEILRSVDGGIAPHHRSPASAIEPAGQDLGAPLAPGFGRQYRSNGGRMPVLSG
jgi:hypothetical protein